jgi:hypothetical protein
MNTQTKLAVVAALLLNSALFTMDAEAVLEVPKARLTFAQQLQAKKDAAAAKQAADVAVIAQREDAARREALAGAAGKKTLAEFATEAVEGKVGDHFVVAHAGKALIDTTTHKAIPIAHEAFNPEANTHMTVVDAQALVIAETQAKDLAIANAAKTQRLLDVVKTDFGGDVGAAVDAALPALCGALKVGTDVEASDNNALKDALMAADAGADALVAKFLVAHGAFALNSPEAAKVKHYVDLIKFFMA